MKETMSSRVLRWVSPVVLGAAAAVLTTVLTGRTEERAQPMVAEVKLPSLQPTSAGPRAAEGNQGAKIHDLERRLAELEASKEAQPSSDSPSPTPPPLMAPEEIQRELQQQQDTLLAKHESEPLDPTWSPRAVTAFQQDLADLAEKGDFQVGEVECKTTSCIAAVEWPNYEAAQRENGTLAMHAYKVNCAKRIWVPEPQDREARYRATVIFDCSQSRENPNLGKPPEG